MLLNCRAIDSRGAAAHIVREMNSTTSYAIIALTAILPAIAASTPVPLIPLGYGHFNSSTVWKGELYFQQVSQNGAISLWKSNGTPDGTGKIKDTGVSRSEGAAYYTFGLTDSKLYWLAACRT